MFDLIFKQFGALEYSSKSGITVPKRTLSIKDSCLVDSVKILTYHKFTDMCVF